MRRGRQRRSPTGSASPVAAALGLLGALTIALPASAAAASPTPATGAAGATPATSAAPAGTTSQPARTTTGGSAPAPWFLRYPTDQLGVPGDVETAELTPQNSLFTGRLELALRVGPDLRPWGDGARTLDDGGLPVYRSERRVGDLEASATAFAVTASGVPVVHLHVAVRNPTSTARPFAIGLDEGFLGAGLSETLKGDLARAPYRFPRGVEGAAEGLLQQPGDAFDPAWSRAWAGETLTRSGSPLLAARLVRATPGARPARVLRTTAPSAAPDAVTGRLRVRGVLRPGERRAVDVVVPLRAVPPGHPALADPYDAGLRRLRASWRPVLARGMRLSTPEPAVDRAWDAGLLAMLVPRHRLSDGRWVQTPNKFQYQASWIRDTTMIAHTLDLLGLHREAGEDVEFLTRWQDPDGLLQSRIGQYDGMGQALWAFGDHVERAGDLAMASRLLPAADRAMTWVEERLRADPRWVLPASDPKDDNEHVPGHATGDLLWLAGGTRRVVAVAEALGDGDRADAWARIADGVEAVARERIAEGARAGVVPPVLDAAGGRRWGELWLAWPTRVFSPTAPVVRATMAAAARDEREGLALWGGRLHLYIGLRRLHTELLAGHPDAVVDGLYATLAHLTSTGGTWEQGTAPGGSREVYRALGPHGWASADLLSLLHDMVVREDGDGVRLLDAVPPAWLRPGAVTRARGAHTALGTVNVELRATPTGATLRWDADVPPGTPLRFRAPRGTTAVRLPGAAPGRREIVLPARRGALRLRWRTGALVRTAPDAETTRAALQAAYARRR